MCYGHDDALPCRHMLCVIDGVCNGCFVLSSLSSVFIRVCVRIFLRKSKRERARTRESERACVFVGEFVGEREREMAWERAYV